MKIDPVSTYPGGEGWGEGVTFHVRNRNKERSKR